MRPMLSRLPRRLAPLLAVALLAALPAALPAQAQSVTGARAFPAYNEVAALTSSGTTVWAGTNAGVFSFTPASGEIARYTSVDGLRGGVLQTLDFDRRRNVLWVGYADGGLDRLDAASGAITRIEDISRASQYASRGIRRIRVVGDSLYLATDFGVVVFDPVALRVRNTYARLGPLNVATPVNDVIEAPLPDGRPGVWVASEGGLVRAPRGEGLQSPAPWTADPGFAFPSLSLALFQNRVHVAGGPAGALDLYRRADAGTWERQFLSPLAIPQLQPDGDRLLALTRFQLIIERPGGPRSTFNEATVTALTGLARTDDGQLWAGDGALGLLELPGDPPPGDSPFGANAVVPNGPYTNNIEDVAVAPDGTVWVATRNLDAPGGTSAVGRFDGTTWTNYLRSDSSLAINQAEFFGAAVDDQGRFYTGTSGNSQDVRDGLTVFTDGVPALYTVENSTLRGFTGDAQFVLVSDIAFEGDRRWVVNRQAEAQLHLFDADDSWTALPTPDGIAPAATFFKLAIDGFGQKWIALARTGLAVWDTGADPADPADDRGRQFTAEGANGQGLPNTTVNAVTVDGAGRVWIGTDRGIAYVFSPGAAFGGDPSLATPQWPIVVGADGDDEADYLLRDLRVNDLAVDPSGRVWVASSSGAYLLNAEGNDIDRAITSANSPLPTDDINRVAVDPSSGRVYFVTDFGLFSVDGDATRAVVSSEALTVAPNPFRPAQHSNGVEITGLNAAEAEVRILTVDGEVVHARSTRGGSFTWDGRDDRTGRPVPSGVYIVAAASETGETIYGKVAVIR